MITSELITIQSGDNTAAAWAEAAQRWLEAVEARRGSTGSRAEYAKILRGFFVQLESKHPALVSGADCQRWVATLKEQGLTPATIKARIGAVSSFYKFVTTKFEVEPGRYLHNFNPTSAVTRPHVNPYERSQGLSAQQARAMLKACDRSTIKGLRDFALISFYIYTGRRKSEIARLRWADLRPGAEPGKMEYHYTGKGNKTFWRELPEPVWAAIQAYLSANGRLEAMKADNPLFVAEKATATALARAGQPISEATINQIVDYAARRAGLEHVKPHALRHTAAKLRRSAGESLEDVSNLLDHSSLAVTQVYLQNVESRSDIGWKRVEALIGLD
jgi:site-specific recombinase XerD